MVDSSTALPFSENHKKGEEDVYRNADSMVNHDLYRPEAVDTEGLPITRKQQKLRRLEAKEAELKALAKEFSQLVFNDGVIANDAYSSMNSSHWDNPPSFIKEKKTRRKKKSVEVVEVPDDETARIHARVDVLLEKFLRSKGKIN
jgi:hypothetical protein